MRKLNFTKALKNALPYVLTLILVGIMTFVAEILGEGEIIFPEITAVCNWLYGYTKARLESQ